ncbi:TadE/TadG family type IV pilus assembly protein [Sphingomonas colocasiae]|uniref:Pilus assembly protein n=1 Tax=Sphingomonas colocasiae TaxID=1848973 RepID=A0ABS7PHB8_9SPHN|nr:TadE/TadG family type IV pilus assembly protein [Sphingomonas colocasiae]MBY8820691.1 pilus assembly protein [Sphingomonas colocasiae]
MDLRSARGFLSRLARDKAGNTMLLMAGALVPIAGMIGGAVDLSRAYLVQSRMQQACDAGALAGRKSMSGNVLATEDKDEAYRFFFYNFPNGTMGSAQITQDSSSAANRVFASKTSDNQLQIDASTSVPTTILKIVNVRDIRVNVSCEAEEYYVNTDVMFVLDTTGSMNCAIGADISCSASSEASNSKMSNMRTAIKKLYTDLIPARDALTVKSLRLRIGFVQYSQNVNVGKLLYAKSTDYIRNPYPYYNSAGTLKSAYNHDSNWFNSTWTGCIEERSTTTALTASSTTIPSDAYDLDIATLPTSDATRWGPADPTQEQSEGSSSTANACPKPAKALQEWPTQDGFDTHVNTLTTGIGRTHHDSGIIWGTRMIASTGVFGADNPTIYNNVKVAKTIVFMTDGYMDVATDYYTAYSVPKSAGRTASKNATESQLEAIHERRFTLMCSRAKELGIDIWVVAILPSGSTISSAMQNCATTTSQAITVGNSTDLTAAFKRISDKVGNLRLGR